LLLHSDRTIDRQVKEQFRNPMQRSFQFGSIPPGILIDPPTGPILSPFLACDETLEDLPDGHLDALAILAPAGTLERAYVLALGLAKLKPGGRLVALALKDRGGARLKKELEALGCTVAETARRHHRICETQANGDPTTVAAAMAAGAPQRLEALGLWTQPGIFSWDRIDPGTEKLLDCLPQLKGRGADLGCGLGVLAHAVLSSPDVTSLCLIDYDRRAVDCAKRNVADPRASFVHADLRVATPDLADLDFVVMNPPFHAEGREDRRLGPLFIERAALMLRKGGVCWLVANVALPYEAPLSQSFSSFREVRKAGGFKVIEAVR
jgi:16S rRNA (guanine1207-N2)-methyltransferase